MRRSLALIITLLVVTQAVAETTIEEMEAAKAAALAARAAYIEVASGTALASQEDWDRYATHGAEGFTGVAEYVGLLSILITSGQNIDAELSAILYDENPDLPLRQPPSTGHFFLLEYAFHLDNSMYEDNRQECVAAWNLIRTLCETATTTVNAIDLNRSDTACLEYDAYIEWSNTQGGGSGY